MVKKKKDSSPKTSGKRKKWGGAGRTSEDHFERDISVTDELKQTLLEEIPKMKMITPSILSQKYNIRISVIKHLLNELQAANKIKPYIYSRRLKVFVPA
ncbi:MAG: hypothetical protein ACTSRS_19845 [Candidatus Helarchaeota archaeon]